MLQAFPPNTGVGWYTMATGAYPADHGSTNNTYFRAGDTFSNRTSFSAPGTCRRTRSPTPPSERARRSPRSTGSAGRPRTSQAPTVDFTSFFTNRGVLVGAADPVEAAGSAFFGVNYEDATLAPRRGLERRPGRRSRRAAEADDVAGPTRSSVQRRGAPATCTNPNRTYNVYFYDSVDGRRRQRSTTSSSARSARPARRRRSTWRSATSRHPPDGRERPDRHAGRPDGRPLREAHLADPRWQPVQALPDLAHARHRALQHGRATPCPPAARARTSSRSTSPTTSRHGRPATSRRSKRP